MNADNLPFISSQTDFNMSIVNLSPSNRIMDVYSQNTVFSLQFKLKTEGMSQAPMAMSSSTIRILCFSGECLLS